MNRNDDKEKKEQHDKHNTFLGNIRNRINGASKEKLKDLRREFRTYLGRLSLKDLSGLAQIIGNVVNSSVISISVVISELKERANKKGEVIDINVGGRTVGEVKPRMSKEEEENIATILQKSVTKDSVVNFAVHEDPYVKKTKEDIEDFQSELDRLKCNRSNFI